MTIIHRYERSQELFNSYFCSKLTKFTRAKSIGLKGIAVQAGLYKLNSLMPEHGIILSTLTGQPSQINYQFHGKRQRRTISVNTRLIHYSIWPFLDKFIHELITHMHEFSTPKSKKWGIIGQSYTLRLRQKFTTVDDFDDLVDGVMHDTHKGIYLPLTLHLQLNTARSHYVFETYLRMLRLPVVLFKRKARPAFDDKVSFDNVQHLYREYL